MLTFRLKQCGSQYLIIKYKIKQNPIGLQSSDAIGYFVIKSSEFESYHCLIGLITHTTPMPNGFYTFDCVNVTIRGDDACILDP